MTGIERIGRIMKRRPVDRIGVYEHVWDETIKRWTDEGHLKEGEDLPGHFGFDLDQASPFRWVADLGVDREPIEETEDAVVYRDGNGVVQKRWKNATGTPQLIDFRVKTRPDWEAVIRPLLKPDRSRIRTEEYAKARETAHAQGRFFFCSSMHVFEMMRALCGHENMLVGMALDPAWIADMVDVYSRLIVDLMEDLFSRAGEPDGVWFYEDLGFKDHPFLSPSMYRDLLLPAHRRTMQFAHARGLPVVCHSCGFVEPLIPGLMEAGVDCLQAMEVKAGMDLVRLFRAFGEKLSFMGGLDVRVLFSGDPAEVDRELSAKIPTAMGRYGYVLHTDHSVPGNVSYGTYRHFLKRGLEIGTYA